MNFRNAIKAIFGKAKNVISSAWKEVGAYRSLFSSFGTDMYASDIVRACIRALAEHSSKANVKVFRGSEKGRVEGDKALQRMIQQRPNLYMNGKDFLYKVRTRLEIDNTVFIYINRDDFGRCVGLYPMPPSTQTEAIDVAGSLYIKFHFENGTQMAASWEDLAVLRKDYNKSDIWGDDNTAILTSLDLLNTTNEGMANAIKSTANLRAILQTTNAMLAPADIKKMRDDFLADYAAMSNTSGVAALDARATFTPIDLKPHIANYKNVEELRMNIYRYFGVNEKVLTADHSSDGWQAFYESQIEGFLLALSLELTNKVFTNRERGFGNEIIFEANRMAYLSTEEKTGLYALVDRGIMTINEHRQILNLAPIDGGDIPRIRKEYVELNKLNEVQGVDDNASTE